jgi:ketosteroid isomerase-like protein
VPWLQPFPDELLDQAAEDEPDRDVVGRETMELVFLTAIQHLPPDRAEWTRGESTEDEREVLRRYMDVAAAMDIDAMAALLHEDVTLTMPPAPFWFVGREAMLKFIAQSVDPASPMFLGHWRHLPTRANGRPAAAGYVRRAGTEVYRAQALDVLRVQDGRITEITTFEPHLFPAFGLPLTVR